MVETMGIKAGYKQTEVGIIPMDWDVKKLTDLVDKFVNGGTPSTQIAEYWNGNIPWITGADILNQKVAVIRRYISKEAVKNSSTNIIEKGNLLLVSRTGVGKLSITPFDIAISQDFTGIYVKSSELDTVYLFRYFDFAQKELKTQNQGTSIQGITRETLSSIKIPVPPTKTEQTAIATALNDADALITQLEKLIAKKRAIKQGAMQELLKPKDGWKVFDFKNIFRKLNAKRQQIQTKEYQQSGKYPVIDQGKQKVVAYSDNSSKVFSCPNDGLIVFGDHTREIKFVDYDFIVGADGTQLITVNKEHSIKFFFYQLLLKEVPNTGYNRHFKFLLEMEFIIPDKIEQTRIAQILSDMDAEIEALENKLNKYKMIKQGMMQNLLTGRIRLV